MRYAKIFVLLCCAMHVSIALTGCKLSYIGSTQINKIEFIRAVGIDKCAADGTIQLTIATQRVMSGGGEGGSQQKQSEIMHSEGKTGLEAVRNYWSFSDKRPFWGHLEYILIGEEAAKEGILKYLDIFTRDPEVRLNLNVFIVKGTAASEVIRLGNTGNKFIFDRLEGIKDNYWGLSMINDVSLMEVMYILDTEYLSLYVPCVKLTKHSERAESENEDMDITLEGFAVFDSDKLAGFLEREMARGLNFLRNNVQSGVITVRSPNGEKISLEIIESNSRMKPTIENGELRVMIEIELNSNIGEIQSEEDVFSDKSIEHLKDQQEQIIKEEVKRVIDLAQEKNLDYFGMGNAVFHKYPDKWEDVFEKNWRSMFPEIDFDITVESQITRTYDIKQPIGSK